MKPLRWIFWTHKIKICENYQIQAIVDCSSTSREYVSVSTPRCTAHHKSHPSCWTEQALPTPQTWIADAKVMEVKNGQKWNTPWKMTYESHHILSLFCSMSMDSLWERITNGCNLNTSSEVDIVWEWGDLNAQISLLPHLAVKRTAARQSIWRPGWEGKRQKPTRPFLEKNKAEEIASFWRVI